MQRWFSLYHFTVSSCFFGAGVALIIHTGTAVSSSSHSHSIHHSSCQFCHIRHHIGPPFTVLSLLEYRYVRVLWADWESNLGFLGHSLVPFPLRHHILIKYLGKKLGTGSSPKMLLWRKIKKLNCSCF